MHIGDYALESMCDVLEISKRTYYKYRAAEDKDYYAELRRNGKSAQAKRKYAGTYWAYVY